MKINEFLAEINMLPEAVHLLNELQESGRIGEKNIRKISFCMRKTELCFMKKSFGKGLSACVSVLFMPHGRRNL